MRVSRRPQHAKRMAGEILLLPRRNSGLTTLGGVHAGISTHGQGVRRLGQSRCRGSSAESIGQSWQDQAIFSMPEYAHGIPGKTGLDWVVGSGELKPVTLFKSFNLRSIIEMQTGSHATALTLTLAPQ